MSIRIEDFIPTGFVNRISRAQLAQITGLDDRNVRKSIELSDEPIISRQGGYFIPLDTAEEQSYKNEYVAEERARAITKLRTIKRKFG